jgi:ubiquinone/menaquinone biosynthesis C-methylase UbiE
MPFFEDNKFDLIYANNVLEHIENPDSFLKEVGRVVKHGGIFIAKTPNKNHYMPLLASLLPEKLHTWYHKLKGRPSEDTFPAFYRLNSRKSVKKYVESAGFEIVEINMIEGRPEYLRFNTISYFFGIAYERLVNLLRLDGIKIVMYIILRKK